ncbi:uncharacterized protein V1510DRAFT_361536 [Dipodascopsis tothii]|uniref:uncharacterized protein n=1 Tax=Dipodascopsis tothii TaxID=44089 RepID=UPI0034CE9916
MASTAALANVYKNAPDTIEVNQMQDLTYYASPASFYGQSIPQNIHAYLQTTGQLGQQTDKMSAPYNGQAGYSVPQSPMAAPMYTSAIPMPIYPMYAGYSSPHMLPMDINSAQQTSPTIVDSSTAGMSYGASIANVGLVYRSYPPSSGKPPRYDKRWGAENNNRMAGHYPPRNHSAHHYAKNGQRGYSENKAEWPGHGRKPSLALQQINENRIPGMKLPSPLEHGTPGAPPELTPANAGFQDFPIPLAISSVSDTSPAAIEEALKNPRKTTNVYIRGLAPNTTDEVLTKIVSRYGALTTAKAMMDSNTKLCKGFGFAQFSSEQEAVNCISGLAQYGYQTSFAKQSFANRLKELQDAESTNIYFSNIPRTWDKPELKQLLDEYTVVSLKVLRDNQGNSRGVGFARFMERQVAEDVINKFHGQPIGENGTPIQVRFSDTEAQKKLKQITVKKRNWRAHEYHLLAARRALDELETKQREPRAISITYVPPLSATDPRAPADQEPKQLTWHHDNQAAEIHEGEPAPIM